MILINQFLNPTKTKAMANIFRSIYKKKKFTQCPFCQWPKTKKSLILASTKNYYLTLNEFPYIEHHLLIAPYQHITSLSKESASLEKEQLTKIGDKLLTALGVKNYTVLDRSGNKSGRSLAHIHRHLIPVDGPHDMFYRFADVSQSWDKHQMAKKYKKILKDK